ncbi:metal-dependent phosphohydrolase [Planotetraspora thailandica]|uniref:HD domain-containing protein n=1 Tax=Planotetraspora thailandica TaxID=487172 RepID=UPI0027E3EFA4|nr:metal-dependent phosphohydrolase [Planotetraspora thailandica]
MTDPTPGTRTGQIAPSGSALGLPDSAAADALAAELCARWAEPHRRYHTTVHLRAVLKAIEPLAALADDVVAVRLAAWFHDAVYDGRPGWDEERSAQLAEARLPACGVDPGRVREVARLVRVTASHSYDAGDADAAVLCDADLAVLGGSPEEYAAYARAVRAEYRHVPDDLFSAGRSAVLRELLTGHTLYGTAAARDLWDGRARENMTRELAELAGLAG